MASAAKRPLLSGSSSGSGHSLDHHAPPPTEKRLRPTPKFVSVVFEALKQNQLEKLCLAMEPTIRKVVGEEVKRWLELSTITASRHLSWSRAHAPEPPSVDIPLHLVFPKTLKQPIFTMSRIISCDDSPIQVLLTNPTVDQTVNTTAIPLSALPFPVKLEILVLDGDFQDGDGMWTVEEFEDSIVKAREGRRPLLVGDLAVTLRPGDGSCGRLAVISFGELQLTDNSSWVRSRKFRLAIRAIPGSYGSTIRIREAVTEAFVVRDHRGESYKKHYPPKLEDEVWRLEKIGKGGSLHINLVSAGAQTVQDFLKMSVVYPQLLRSKMGSEKNWKASLKHAGTCEVGQKRYIFQAFGNSVILDPICRVVSACINGQICADAESTSLVIKACIDDMVKTAYSDWDKVQEIEEY